MSYYRCKLPHWQPSGVEYFVTFRLAGTLPAEAVADLKQQRKELLSEATRRVRSSGMLSQLRQKINYATFKKYEHILDDGGSGRPLWLKMPAIAQIVQDAIHYRDKKVYELYAYCIMPNHVHLVFKLIDLSQADSNKFPVTSILKSLKWFTALKANQHLKRKGSF